MTVRRADVRKASLLGPAGEGTINHLLAKWDGVTLTEEWRYGHSHGAEFVTAGASGVSYVSATDGDQITIRALDHRRRQLWVKTTLDHGETVRWGAIAKRVTSDGYLYAVTVEQQAGPTLDKGVLNVAKIDVSDGSVTWTKQGAYEALEIADGGNGANYECICDINEADQLFVAMTDPSLSSSERSVLMRISATDGSVDWSTTMSHGGSPVHVADLAGFASSVGIVGHIGSGGPNNGMVRTYSAAGAASYTSVTKSDVHQIEFADELGSPVSDESLVIGSADDNLTESDLVWSLSPAGLNYRDRFGPTNARNYSGVPSRDGYIYATDIGGGDTELRRYELDNISSASPYDDADFNQTGSTLDLSGTTWGGRHSFGADDVRLHMMSVYGTGSEVWIHMLKG